MTPYIDTFTEDNFSDVLPFVMSYLGGNSLDNEVLGLFVLLIVGVVLLGEGGHKADLQFFGYHVEAMSKTTFYFSITVLFIVELVQSKYQKRLLQKNSKRV